MRKGSVSVVLRMRDVSLKVTRARASLASFAKKRTISKGSVFF